MYDKPTATNSLTTLSSAAIAHEITHLFFHYAGLSIEETWLNNVSQDARMAYALNPMRYNPLFVPDPKLPDDFDFKKDIRVDVVGGKGYEKTRYNPSSEQLIRIGAKRVSTHLQGKN